MQISCFDERHKQVEEAQAQASENRFMHLRNDQTKQQQLFEGFVAVNSEGTSADQSAKDSAYAVDVAQPQQELSPPPMYRVLLHNDDFTPMEFVVAVLQSYFAMDQSRAVRIMLDVHRRGVGVCGVFTKEIAETKTMQVTEKAKQHQYPLKCTHEEDKESSSSVSS